jgi:hypothetical protein
MTGTAAITPVSALCTRTSCRWAFIMHGAREKVPVRGAGTEYDMVERGAGITEANRTDTLAELMSSQSLERMREVGKVNIAVE